MPQTGYIGTKTKYPGELVLAGDRFAVDFAADMKAGESAVSGTFLVVDAEGNDVTSTLTAGSVQCEGTIVGVEWPATSIEDTPPGTIYDVFVTAVSDLTDTHGGSGTYQEAFRVRILQPVVTV